MAAYLDLVGMPWERHATGPDAYDCAGVCAEYLRRLGREVHPEAFFSPDGGHWDHLGQLGEVELEPGDVVLSLNDEELHVEVRLATRDSLTLTATRTRGTLVRPSYSIGNPIGVYRLRQT